MYLMKKDMKNSLFKLLATAAIILIFSSCNKDNILVGTSWICEQDQSKLYFKDNTSGLYSWYENKEYEDYDFTYSYTKEKIVIRVSFPKRTFVMSGTVDGESMHFGGKEIPLDYYKSK